MEKPRPVKKYLSRQKNNKWKLETNNIKPFNNIIVIPAVLEFENVKKLIESLSKNSIKYLKETLLIFVVNNKLSDSLEIKNDNKKLLNYLRAFNNNKINIGIVDASSKNKELPEKEGGVGLARKIGMDLSLNYFNYNTSNKKLLITLDADCTVSENYLEAIVTEFNKNNYSAGYVNFEHPLPSNIEEQMAIINYEIFLRYYVLGLKYANSHYAFHTIGSTIICDFESYIKVGGMNKRKAGEDFYFMEKLAKITNIKRIKSATVYPSARISNRVPFGTGKRIEKFIKNKQNEYWLYSSESFEVLKNWLELFHKNKLSSKEYMEKAKRINKSLYAFLQEQKFVNNWNKIIDNSKSEKQLEKQKLMWMDGFKTLKLIHYLRDNEFPQEKMFHSLDSLFTKMKIKNNIRNKSDIPPLSVQKEYLTLLREIDS